jgi:hypothetical protein
MYHTTLAAAFTALAPGKNPHSSALYKQTGHFVTGKEVWIVFLVIIALVVVAWLRSALS